MQWTAEMVVALSISKPFRKRQNKKRTWWKIGYWTVQQCTYLLSVQKMTRLGGSELVGEGMGVEIRAGDPPTNCSELGKSLTTVTTDHVATTVTVTLYRLLVYTESTSYRKPKVPGTGKKIMMLHVFNVDAGNMLFFDVLMCAELVSVLQEHIFNVTKIPINKQVLLVSGGIALLPTQRVCAYPVGTDTNPIFLYNKQYYLHPGSTVPLDLMVLEDGPELSDLQDEVDEGLALGDSMNALVLRAHLAFRLCGMSQVALQACQRLVHEQHLQHQGFMIAIANMSLTVPGAKSKTEEFLTVLQEFLEKKPHYLQLIETLEEVEATLANIPLLPSLAKQVSQDPMTSISSCKDIEEQRDNMTLLDWLQARGSGDTVQQLSQTCMRDIQQITDMTIYAREKLKSFDPLLNTYQNIKYLKSETILIGTSRLLSSIDLNNSPTLILNGHPISYSDKVKNLGLTITKNLSRADNVTETCGRVFAGAQSLTDPLVAQFGCGVNKPASCHTDHYSLVRYLNLTYKTNVDFDHFAYNHSF
ncbi:reticulophagy [Homalodisca vitripennis]|nr:reticulophagy [Homalodisca vitripennis]